MNQTSQTSRTSKDKIPVAACMFRIVERGVDVFYVMAARGRDGGEDVVVHAFPSVTAGVLHFTDGYDRACRRGNVAGAFLNLSGLNPRVFHFGEVENLVELCGETARPVTLSSTGIHEVAFRCLDAAAARAIYDDAEEPRLLHGSGA
jgi:hypothetical protein